MGQPWHRKHRRALVFAGLGAGVIAWFLWLTYIPKRMHDRHDVLPVGEVAQWDYVLDGVLIETGVDIRIVIDSAGSDADLAARALDESRQLGVGRSTDRRGLLLLVDLTSGNLRLEVGPGLEGLFPDGLVGHILRGHTAGVLGEDTMSRSLTSTLMMIIHRTRESSLALGYDPAVRTEIRDSTRLAAGGGATFSFAAGEPLRLDRTPDPLLEAALGPGATPEETYERYRTWLSLPVYVPRAHFLTPQSRRFYEHDLKITPAFWEFLRYLDSQTTWRFETRGNLAVAFATTNPLITPLFFRKSAEGWQMDVMAELLNSRNLVGSPYSWGLSRQGGAHDAAFADLMFQIDGVWRFMDGANQRMRRRGSR